MSVENAEPVTSTGPCSGEPELARYSVAESPDGGWAVGKTSPGEEWVALETRLTEDSANFWMGSYALSPDERARTVHLVALHSGEDGFEDYVMRAEIASNAEDPERIAAAILQGYSDICLSASTPVVGALAITVDQKSDPTRQDMGLAASWRALAAAGYLPHLFSGYPFNEIMESID